jgi:sulfate transport system permease protein
MSGRRHPAGKLVIFSVCGYLLLLVLFPIGAIVRNAFANGWNGFIHALTAPIGASAILLSIESAFVAAVLNAAMGTLIGYRMARDSLPGKRILNALVDLPLAIPTTVGGLMLVLVYSPASHIGSWLAIHHVQLVYSRLGIVMAMVFVTFPYTVRTVEPLVESLDRGVEEAALTLGASRTRVFWQVLLPSIWPGIVTGFTLTFSRCLAEFGAVVLVSGNLPMRTQVAPVYLYGLLENDDLAGAAAVSLFLLVVSIVVLLLPLARPGRFVARQRLRLQAPEIAPRKEFGT